MHSELAGRAGEPSGDREEASSEGLGGHQLLVQTDASCPAGQVMHHHLDGQLGTVGGKAARGQVIEPHAVLEVSDRILDLGVAAMVGVQIQWWDPRTGRRRFTTGRPYVAARPPWAAKLGYRSTDAWRRNSQTALAMGAPKR